MTEVPGADSPLAASPVVEVRGEAVLRGMPDLATLTVTVRATGRRPDEVTDQLARRSAQVRAVIERHQNAVESSASTGLQVGPTFERGTVLRPRGYEGSVTTTLVLHDFAVLGPLVVALGEVEQCAISGPAWSLRRENPMYRSARLAAVEDARRRADDYADAFGALVVGLIGVSDLEAVHYGGIPLASRLARGLPDEQPALELEPEEQEVAGRVTVRFRMSEPDLGAVLPDEPTIVPDIVPGPLSPLSPTDRGRDRPPDDGVPAR